MSERLITEIHKSDDEVIRLVREDRGDGRVRLHLREWFRDAAHDWRPGKGGITLKMDQVHPIVAGILQAASEGRRR